MIQIQRVFWWRRASWSFLILRLPGGWAIFNSLYGTTCLQTLHSIYTHWLRHQINFAENVKVDSIGLWRDNWLITMIKASFKSAHLWESEMSRVSTRQILITICWFALALLLKNVLEEFPSSLRFYILYVYSYF